MPSRAYDAALKKVRAICLDLPECHEVEAWGHPTFRAGKKKMFAGFGTHEDGMSLGLNVGFERQDELVKDDRFFLTPYSAHRGWISLRIDGKTDWNEVRRLMIEAFRQVALKRMLSTLEAEVSFNCHQAK